MISNGFKMFRQFRQYSLIDLENCYQIILEINSNLKQSTSKLLKRYFYEYNLTIPKRSQTPVNQPIFTQQIIHLLDKISYKQQLPILNTLKPLNHLFQTIHRQKMLQNRQQKPVCPQQMFQRLLNQSYREAQCEDQSQKLKKQRIVLIELIQEYERLIQEQLVRNHQCDQLQRLKLQKLEEIDRLKMERLLIERSVSDEMARIAVSEGQRAQKEGLIYQLNEVRSVNGGLRLKIRDLLAYVQRLEQSNAALQNQKATIQLKSLNRLQVNPSDWRQRIDCLQKMHQINQNQLRARVLQKQSQRIKQVRRQQQQIRHRNQARWQQFRRTAFKSIHHPPPPLSNIQPFISRQPRSASFKSFRVI